MSAAHAFLFPCRANALHASCAPSPQPAGLAQTYAPAPPANDYVPLGYNVPMAGNCHLQLVDKTTHVTSFGQLVTASGKWGAGSYTYDSLGNIRQKNLEKKLGARTVNMSYNGLNRLSSYTDTAGPDKSLNYDSRGNVTQLGGLFFTYDYADQPSYISGTATGTYKYDGNKKPPKTTSSQGDALLRARVKSVVNGQEGNKDHL